jgi:hypothetical protein
MRVIAIDIRGSKAAFAALEGTEGSISDLTGKFTSLDLKDQKDSAEIKRFQHTVFDFFRGIGANKIAVLGKNTGGKFMGSAVSFKLEGLIQCFQDTDVEIISPQTIAAFEKKHEIPILAKYTYQRDAARLAAYLISN